MEVVVLAADGRAVEAAHGVAAEAILVVAVRAGIGKDEKP
jgi:hypothetical protein